MLFGRSLSNHAKTVGMYVLSYRNPKTYLCCPSMARIAQDMGITRQAVQDSVNELLSSGVLTKRLIRGHNEYTFTACPPPGMYADIEDATADELREMVEGLRRRHIRRTIIDRSPFPADSFKSWEEQKRENYKFALNVFPVDYGTPGEWIPAEIDLPTVLPF
jgi:predicted DNA-binding transcriptional regulator